MIDNVNTYNGLVEAIQQWTNRNDAKFISNIPLFISLAQQEFFIDCSNLGNQFYVTGTFSPQNSTFIKPSNWGKTLSFTYIGPDGKYVVLKPTNPEFIRTYVPNNNVSQNEQTPRYYSDYGYNFFIISPTPVSNYDVELVYFGKVQPITLYQQTNWITEKAFDALFWSCLNKACRFIDNSTDADIYLNMYKDRINAINNYNTGHINDRSVDATKD